MAPRCADGRAATAPRREAARSFPSVFETGLPAYAMARRAGLNANAAAIQTPCALMASIDDTTVLYRGGIAPRLHL